MKNISEIRKQPVVLFMDIPVGATILFNGCICIKLDKEHVRFVSDTDGNAIDYSKRYNKRYARTTQQEIGGTPCRIVELPAAPRVIVTNTEGKSSHFDGLLWVSVSAMDDGRGVWLRPGESLAILPA